MNAVEIEEPISKLVGEPFDPENFPFRFLEAFGNIETTIKKLRSGNSNASDVAGGVLQPNNIHLTVRSAAERVDPHTERFPGAGIGTIPLSVSSNLLSGLLEAVAGPPYDGEADLPVIAATLHIEIDDLFPVAETLQLLRFAEVEGGDIKLTAEGKRFAGADTDARTQHLITCVALAAHVRRVLDERPSHRTPWSPFSDELKDHMASEDAEQTLRAVISWGRYAEVFAYDDHTQMFSLDNP